MQAQCRKLDVEIAAKGTGNHGKERGKGLYRAGSNEEDETENTADHQENGSPSIRAKELLTMRGCLVR